MNQFLFAALCTVGVYVLAVLGLNDLHHHYFANLPPVKDAPVTSHADKGRGASKREMAAVLYAFNVRGK